MIRAAKLLLISAAAVVFVASACTEALSQSIVTREQWQAKPPILNRIGRPKESSKGIASKLLRLQKHAQRNKPWGDIPYHFYIDLNGVVGEGRSLKYSGDTNTGYNPANRIHIVLEGDFNTEKPGKKQLKSLQSLVKQLRTQFSLSVSKTYGHNDRAPTSCPGRYLNPIVDKLASGSAI